MSRMRTPSRKWKWKMNEPKRTPHISPLAQVLGVLFYVLVVMAIVLLITGAGALVVKIVRSVLP
jgi:hypothetical protein